MATANKSAFGTLLKLGNGASSETFAAIAEVRKLSVTIKQSTIEVTNHQSPDRAMEVVASIIDGGVVVLSGNWLGRANATQGFNTVGIGYDLVAGTLRHFQIAFTDASPATTFSFTALVTDFSVNADYNSNLQFSGSLKVTGLGSWTGGAS